MQSTKPHDRKLCCLEEDLIRISFSAVISAEVAVASKRTLYSRSIAVSGADAVCVHCIGNDFLVGEDHNFFL